MLTTRRTVADGVRMCTGRAAPSRIGPMVTPPPEAVFSRLKAMFAASSVGITRRFASPRNRERGNTRRRISSESAASPCISPSASSWGARSAMRSEEHTSELQSHSDLVCRLLLEKKKENNRQRRREVVPIFDQWKRINYNLVLNRSNAFMQLRYCLNFSARQSRLSMAWALKSADD